MGEGWIDMLRVSLVFFYFVFPGWCYHTLLVTARDAFLSLVYSRGLSNIAGKDFYYVDAANAPDLVY